MSAFRSTLSSNPVPCKPKTPVCMGPLTSRPRLTLMWPDGSYAINYQRGGQFPRYVLQTPDTTLQTDMGQTIGREEVSAVLTTLGAGESDLSKRIWDKVLLENTDDVVHVLSLKGLFLY